MTREPYRQTAHITHGYFSGLLRDCAATFNTAMAVSRS
jgi:hypothetical protein